MSAGHGRARCGNCATPDGVDTGMGRFPSAAIAIALVTVACARQGAAPAEPQAEFADRAGVVADAWHATVTEPSWRGGLLPLQDLTVTPLGAPTDDLPGELRDRSFTSAVRLPDTAPAVGRVEFPAGPAMPVPLVSAKAAYDAMRRRNPRCTEPGPGPGSQSPSPSPSPSPVGTGADGSVGGPIAGCGTLTVTAATLGTTTLRTSRGPATVPAWMFTVTGMPGPVARVAVAPEAVTPTPPVRVPAASTAASFAGARQLTSVTGARLDFTIAIGSCQQGERGLVHETGEVVVLGGDPGVATGGRCPTLLAFKPVSVTLAGPLGSRPVVDAVTGRLLLIGG